MAFYSVNMTTIKESTAVQTPEDIGVDLDQVEKDIAGPDGIEAHRDEVEAAEEGLIGDPLEEAYFIMYESEYNYNQIMRCIGLNEISQAQLGRDLVLEAEDVTGFFATVKKVLEKMFRALTETVKKVLTKLDMICRGDVKFIAAREKAIHDGATKGLKDEGYDFGDFAKDFSTIGNSDTVASAAKVAIATSAENFDGKSSDEVASKIKESLDKIDEYGEDTKIIDDYFGIKDCAVGELASKLIAKYRGEKKEVSLDASVAKDVIEFLKKDSDAKAIRAAYQEVKKTYHQAITDVNRLEKDVKKVTDYVDYKLKVCEAATKCIKADRNIVNIAYTTFMKLAHAERAQYRRYAVKLAAAGGFKKEEKENAPKNESAGIFSRVAII